MSSRLAASVFYTYFRPSRCDLRVYFKACGKEEAPPGPYEEVLFRLGERHEISHLATFPKYVDLREGTTRQRVSKTTQAIQEGAPVIYQAAFIGTLELNGVKHEVVGEPDFLIRQQNGYIIRDSKMSRRITEKDHPEILRQLEIYGWLFEQTLGMPALRLQIHSGTGDMVELTYNGGTTALRLLEHITKLKTASNEFYSPVGWSKCGGCSFKDYCWPRAEANNDVALIPGVDQSLAATLHEKGFTTVKDLLRHFDEDSLSNFKRPWGSGLRRVGQSAANILRMAKALAEGIEIQVKSPALPIYSDYVMFDLEGLPPQLDDLEKIYLWGIKVFGKHPSEFTPSIAGFGEEGDKEGWLGFLQNAKVVFDKYGDIPFVHWHHYEKAKIDLYLKRYGDRDEIAERVKKNLLDLLPITENSIALPLPSYSLKVVEKYVGFKRTLQEVAGDWAMARYIEATETKDQQKREELMDQILHYNLEDLEATWAVLQWLTSKLS